MPASIALATDARRSVPLNAARTTAIPASNARGPGDACPLAPSIVALITANLDKDVRADTSLVSRKLMPTVEATIVLQAANVPVVGAFRRALPIVETKRPATMD